MCILSDIIFKKLDKWRFYMNEQQNNTHNNVNECRRGIKFSQEPDNSFSLEYSGTIKILTLEEYSKLKHEIQRLESIVKKAREFEVKVREVLADKKAEIEKLNATNERLKTKAETFANQVHALEQRLSKFENNQHGRATKLTPQVQQFIVQNISNGATISQVYKALIERNVDVSYETVRRYVAHIRSQK